MKKLLYFLVVFAVLFLIPISASAEVYDDLLDKSDTQSLYGALPDNTQDILSSIGIESIDYNDLLNVDFNDFLSLINNVAKEQSGTPFMITATVIGVMLIYSMLFSVKTSIRTTSMEHILSVCITLCITCVITVPLISVINSGVSVIDTASDFMLAYIPVMVVIMVSGGYTVSGASYYSLMIFAGQAVAQLSSNVIAPFLKIFLGLSITSAVSPSVNLKSLVETIGKLVKWMLGFVMTMFTALLTFKQLITTAVDSVSTRAVRFTLTSLIPVVGSALSDAYKTVQSSVGLLKSGVGVFVIFAVAIMFFPILIKCLFWMISLKACQSVGDLLGLREPVLIMSCVHIVITTVFAILLCIMSVFIILTALVLLLGGGL